jgi:uncharacterized protein (TIRG00374 family)
MNGKNTLRLAAAFGFGILILFYVFSTMGFEKIVGLLSRIDPVYFLAAAFVYFISDILAALSLKVAVEGLKIRKALPSHMCGMVYSAVTPGRVGYYYTALSIAKKTQQSRSRNIGVLTLMQGIGFLVKVVLCLVAVVYFSRYIVSPEAVNYLVIASLVPLIFVVAIMLVLYTKVVNKTLSRIPFVGGFMTYVASMQEASRNVSARKIVYLILLNIVGWFLIAVQWFLLSGSLGLQTNYADILMLQPLLSAVMFFPFTPSGLGITEGGSALLFPMILQALPVKEANAAGVAFILLVRLNSVFVDMFGLIDMRIHGKEN